jgi:hypothetical protein
MNEVEIALAGYLAFGQLIPQGQQEIVKHAGLQVLHADGAVSLDLTGLAEGAKYDIAEINCTVPHDAKLDGRRLCLALHGPYDSAVFEISQGD